MARLYSNENFPLPVVLALRERGHDVRTFDPDFDAQAERIHRSINQALTLKGQLIRVNRSG